MKTFYLTAQFADVPIKGEKLDEFTDDLMDQLLELENRPTIADPAVSASLAESMFEIELTIGAEKPDEAVTCFMATIRAAFHALGMGTAGWEQLTEVAQLHVRNSKSLIEA